MKISVQNVIGIAMVLILSLLLVYSGLPYDPNCRTLFMDLKGDGHRQKINLNLESLVGGEKRITIGAETGKHTKVSVPGDAIVDLGWVYEGNNKNELVFLLQRPEPKGGSRLFYMDHIHLTGYEDGSFSLSSDSMIP